MASLQMHSFSQAVLCSRAWSSSMILASSVALSVYPAIRSSSEMRSGGFVRLVIRSPNNGASCFLGHAAGGGRLSGSPLGTIFGLKPGLAGGFFTAGLLASGAGCGAAAFCT